MPETQQEHQFKELLLLNIGILVISTSAVLGRYIEIPSVSIILWRCLIGAAALLPFVYFIKSKTSINWKKDGVRVVVAAVLMGGHWIAYFYSLEVANIAIAILSLFSNPAITAILEPLILKTKFNRLDLILGLCVLIGIYIMSPGEFDFSNNIFLGICLGLLSALCYSLRNIVTKDLISKYDSRLLMLTQVGIVALLLLSFPKIYDVMPTWQEWVALIALGVGISALGHSMYARGLRTFDASSVAVLASITPVYAILWGYLFLHETPRTQTLIGGSVILIVVLIRNLYNWLQSRS